MVKNLRHYIQIIFTALTNGYAMGFYKGSIFRGISKMACVPGLNCYSCPGALGACPMGSLQAVMTSRSFNISFYVIGILMVFGALLGRVVCGFLCPFGLVQDLLYKIPFFKKFKGLPFDNILKMLKYVILVLFVIILPLTVLDIIGQGSPWFCKYVCPSGTLFAGIPLVLSNGNLKDALGFLFVWKSFILATIIILSIIVYRPFCKYLCPLGAVYGFFNPISFYRFKVDEDKCTKCGVCSRACDMDIEAYKTPNSFECIRCGECIRVCPHKAITSTLTKK